MSIFTRPHVLVWHAESWQLMSWSEYLTQQPAEPNTSLSDALTALETLSDRCKWDAIILPQVWLSHGQQPLEPDFPVSLYAVAAHTYAGQLLPLAESERVTCFRYLEASNELQFAVMKKSDWQRLTQHTRCLIYSESLISHSGIHSWSALTQQINAFAEYSDDYIERQAARRHSHRVSAIMLAFLILILAYGGVRYSLAPAPMLAEPNIWPEMGGKMLAADSLGYIRVLPPQLRLDVVKVSPDEVFVSLSGRTQDVELWRQNWPSHLPNLRIAEEGLQ